MYRHVEYNIASLLLFLFAILLFKTGGNGQNIATIDNNFDGISNETSSGLPLLTDLSLNATGRDPICLTQSPDAGEGATVESCEDAIAQVPDITTALPDPIGDKLQIPVAFSSCK